MHHILCAKIQIIIETTKQFIDYFMESRGVGSPDHIQESDISMLYYLSHSHFI